MHFFSPRLFLIFAFFHIWNGVHCWPFTRCHVKDKECLINGVQDAIVKMLPGIPELGIPSLDPIDIQILNIPGGNGAVKVDQYFTNAKLWGISTGKIKDVVVDLENKTIILEQPTSNYTLDADYTLNGRILLLPIRGKGRSLLSQLNVGTTHTIQAEEYTKGGSTYYKVVDYRLSLRPERCVYHFDNLFNGDKILGDAMNKVMNDNWLEIFKDVGKNYEQAFAQIYMRFANKVFSLTPLNEVFILDD